MLTRTACTHPGLHARPFIPPELRTNLSAFAGQVMHSSEVRGVARLAMMDVVVVGLGNSSADLVMSLLDHGARRVMHPLYMRVRHPPDLHASCRLVMRPLYVIDHLVPAMHPRIVMQASDASTVRACVLDHLAPYGRVCIVDASLYTHVVPYVCTCSTIWCHHEAGMHPRIHSFSVGTGMLDPRSHVRVSGRHVCGSAHVSSETPRLHRRVRVPPGATPKTERRL